jgi:hypothetical protein
MKLPNPERAVVDIEKLRDYCLSLEHPVGRHKALVFAAALGFTAESAETLREMLLSAVRTGDALLTREGEYGQIYVLDSVTIGPSGRPPSAVAGLSATVRIFQG